MLKHGYHNGYSGTGTNFATWVRVLHLWFRAEGFSMFMEVGNIRQVSQSGNANTFPLITVQLP